MTILSDTAELSFGSHKLVEVECDYNLSATCSGKYYLTYQKALINAKRNNELIRCNNCALYSRASDKESRCKYIMDHSAFDTIDTPQKAYALGWLATDGNARITTIRFGLQYGDISHIHNLFSSILGNITPIVWFTPTPKFSNSLGYTVNSGRMGRFQIYSKHVTNSCKAHLGILTDKTKTVSVRFPELSDSFSWDFLRGALEGDGHFANPFNGSGISNTMGTFHISLGSASKNFLLDISKFLDLHSIEHLVRRRKQLNFYILTIRGSNAFYMLDQLYPTNLIPELGLPRKVNTVNVWKARQEMFTQIIADGNDWWHASRILTKMLRDE